MATQTPPDLEAILADLERAVTAGCRYRRQAPAVAAAAPSRPGPAARPRSRRSALRRARRGQRAAGLAARQLQHAARLVSSTPAPVIGPGQYWYVKGVGAFANSVRHLRRGFHGAADLEP